MPAGATLTPDEVRRLKAGTGLVYIGSDMQWHYAEVVAYRAHDDHMLVTMPFSNLRAVRPATIAESWRRYEAA